MKKILAVVAMTMISTAALAQQQPPPPDGGDNNGPPPAQQQQPPPRNGRGDMGRGGMGRGDMGRGGMGRGDMGRGGAGFGGMDNGGGENDPRMRQFEMVRGYLDAVQRYAQLARDPSMSGIAAVVSAADLMRPRGTDAAIEYFTKLLPEVKSPAVQRAIRLQLVDLYKAAGKTDEALDQLKTLMTAEPGANDMAGPAAPPPPPPTDAKPAR